MLCPVIDGEIILRPNGSGGWSGSIKEDRFPSRGLYWWRGDHWETISERTETIWLDLVSKRRHIDTFTIARNNSLPPGCELE